MNGVATSTDDPIPMISIMTAFAVVAMDQ